MNRLDLLTLVGILGGLASVLVAIFLGGNALVFWNLPSMLITVAGSFCSVLTSYPLRQVREVMGVARQAFNETAYQPEELVHLFGHLARKARREGLLALEDDIETLDDPFYQKGIRMMVDALDPELIHDVLATDLAYTAERHEVGEGIFRTWAGFAPAFGMIGTLVGLIQMLTRLSDPGALGPGMAVALVTTFYGSMLANVVFSPIANKLAAHSATEELYHRVMLEGITSIQSGLNPRVLEEKLKACLPHPRLQRQVTQEATGVEGEVF